MIGLHRQDADRCKLILGHQEFQGNLDLAWEISEGIKRAVTGGRGTVAMLAAHKLALEHHDGRLWLHVHSGTAPTHWFTTCPREELLGWCSHFIHLVSIDSWDEDSIPAEKGHIIPMRLAAFRQHKGPYTARGRSCATSAMYRSVSRFQTSRSRRSRVGAVGPG